MKKKQTLPFITSALFALFSIQAEAGGFLTNTNQSVQFVRNPARDAVIAIDGVFSNPAGVAFMPQGAHLGISLQSVHQKRTIDSRFAAFATEKDHPGQDKRRFDGKADAPVVPSVQFVYNKNKWSFSGSFALVGGGGKAQFPNGLGSFEAAASMLPILGRDLGIRNYSLDSYMRGRQFYYGVQVGAARKLTDNLSVFAGGRIIYATANYYGYLRNISVGLADGSQHLASDYFYALHDKLIAAGMTDKAKQMANLAAATEDINLNCDQTDWGFTPIIGIDWQPNRHWNLAVKYEFNTDIRLKNEAANSLSAKNLPQLAQFRDGEKVSDDMPALLGIGAQYSPIDRLRLSAGYHYYFDKQSSKFNHEEKLLRRGTYEILAGAEYDFSKLVTASFGWQTTSYGVTDKYMKDISFTTSSQSIGFGAAFHLSAKCTLDIGYFQTFYRSYDKEQNDYNGVSSIASMVVGKEQTDAILNSGAGNIFKGSDHFKRTNFDVAVGLTLDI